jgi:hypothetical protein
MQYISFTDQQIYNSKETEVKIYSSSSMALTAHIVPRPHLMRFLNLTLIDNW